MAKHSVYSPTPLLLRFDPQGDPKRPLVVHRPVKFVNGNWDMEVPAGLRTDFASVPYRLMFVAAWLAGWLASYLWGPWIGLAVGLPPVLFVAWLFNPYGTEQRAAVFHDEAYRQGVITRFEADAAYRSIMQRDCVSLPRRLVYYYGVRLGGWLAWRQHRRAEK